MMWANCITMVVRIQRRITLVQGKLLDVSHKWFNLGLELQLSVGALERVRDQYPDPSIAL